MKDALNTHTRAYTRVYMYCSMPKGTSQTEAMPNSEKS